MTSMTARARKQVRPRSEAARQRAKRERVREAYRTVDGIRPTFYRGERGPLATVHGTGVALMTVSCVTPRTRRATRVTGDRTRHEVGGGDSLPSSLLGSGIEH